MRTTRGFLFSPAPSDLDLDPYEVDETTITLDDWRHRSTWGDDGVEVVRLHQHHPARLVA